MLSFAALNRGGRTLVYCCVAVTVFVFSWCAWSNALLRSASVSFVRSTVRPSSDQNPSGVFIGWCVGQFVDWAVGLVG